jgi:uncharacterized membrane protein YccC
MKTQNRSRKLKMKQGAAWKWVRLALATYRARLRFCLRMTVSGLLAYAVGQVLTIPLHGLWVVLTALVVTQMSVGGSLRATADYVLGTLGGAVYASAVGMLVPHGTPIALAGLLAITIAPLAYAAAINPSFRVAPFTATIVLLISTQLGEGPIESAMYRLLEVVLGGAIALTVSLLIFPERAHGLGLESAARVLERLAGALPELLAGITRQIDPSEIRRIQDETGRAVAAFQALAAEAKRERSVHLVAEPDPAPLSRTLLRLRHDLVIFGRAAMAPLPQPFAQRLDRSLAHLGTCASDYLRACASALASRSLPPPLDRTQAALAAYSSEIAALRREGATRTLSSSELEHLFALGFALDQLHHNFADLNRCAQEWARPAG